MEQTGHINDNIICKSHLHTRVATKQTIDTCLVQCLLRVCEELVGECVSRGGVAR